MKVILAAPPQERSSGEGIDESSLHQRALANPLVTSRKSAFARSYGEMMAVLFDGDLKRR
jgi:hypothetical protein